MLLLSWFVSPAAAFCGTFVATGDDAPTNSGSQIAIVKQNGLTTLTMANDVGGSIGDFALVIPVPEVIAEAALHVVDPAIFEHIDGYSAARLVSYDCEDFAPQDEADVDADTDSDTDADSNDTGTVVEGQYVVGEYDVVVLSSTESVSLVSWLQGHGYNVPSESQALLGEYIDSGSYFLAAQVREDAGLQDGDLLSPLQISYTDTAGTLPIRLGTLNSAGSQDLTIFSLTDYGQGGLAIANYPESKVETDCMLPEGESFGDHVDATLDAALPTTGDAHWVTEYSWDNGNCDPCTADGTLTEEDLASLGFVPDYHYGYAYTFTRLHTRYTPEQATQDLVLYTTGMSSTTQLRYIEYNEQLEDLFEVCGLGMVDDPGSCISPGVVDGDSIFAADSGCDCGSGGAGALGGAALLTLAAGLRRRSLRG